MFPAFPDPCTRDARLDALALQVNHLETALKAALQQSIVPFSYHDRNGEDDDDNSNNNNNNSEQPFFLSSFPSPTPKWTWPPTALAIVKELRVLAQQQEDFLRSPLDDLLAWPDKSSADPHLFFDAKEGFETFYRSETWFGQMGFERYVTPYTFSDAWDKRLLHATFLVPTDLKKGCRVRVMWVLHGGGFCTGAGDFIPWYSRSSIEYAKKRNAIVIAPNYPLGPEANYQDIDTAIREFLTWYKYEGSFEPGFDSWTEWLLKTARLQHIVLEKERVIIEGESAGGLAAVMAMFMNAEHTTGLKVHIDGLLLRYPMVRHYSRTFPPDGTTTYMTRSFKQEEVDEHAKKLLGAVKELDSKGLTPSRECDSAPRSMSAAFLLSMSGLWQTSFQRRHLKDQMCTAAEQPSYMDGLERAQWYMDKVDHSLLPPIALYHGYDDQNCPFEDTETFVDILTQNYPDTWIRGQSIFLRKVVGLKAKLRFDREQRVLERSPTNHVGHGFDYDLDAEQEQFLKESYELMDRFWVA